MELVGRLPSEVRHIRHRPSNLSIKYRSTKCSRLDPMSMVYPSAKPESKNAAARRLNRWRFNGLLLAILRVGSGLTESWENASKTDAKIGVADRRGSTPCPVTPYNRESFHHSSYECDQNENESVFLCRQSLSGYFHQRINSDAEVGRTGGIRPVAASLG